MEQRPPVAPAWDPAKVAGADRELRVRFERFSGALARTAGLEDVDVALGIVAREGRGLVCGSATLACAPDADGMWRGAIADAAGTRSASAALMEAARAGLSGADPGTGAASVVPGAAVVTSQTDPAGGMPCVLAVWFEVEAWTASPTRNEVLDAFTTHAAITLANARIYEAAGAALQHERDVVRQKDDFVAMVSHELRTPLTAILGSVSTLRRLGGPMDEERCVQLLDMADRQGARLTRLIEDLLRVAAAESDIEPSQLAPIDLVAFVSELEPELAEIAAGRLTVASECGDGVVRADVRKLRQILTNLVDNALKYAPDSPIEVVVHDCGGRRALSVVDHGPGIPEADRERVFDRFVQLDQSSTRSTGGTGLGLYLCQQLVRVQHGTLTISTTPGGGTTFTVALPGDHTPSEGNIR